MAASAAAFFSAGVFYSMSNSPNTRRCPLRVQGGSWGCSAPVGTGGFGTGLPWPGGMCRAGAGLCLPPAIRAAWRLWGWWGWWGRRDAAFGTTLPTWWVNNLHEASKVEISWGTLINHPLLPLHSLVPYWVHETNCSCPCPTASVPGHGTEQRGGVKG